MIIVDSYGWIEYFADGPKASAYEKYLMKPANIITPTIVLYEVYKKVRQNRKESDALITYAQMIKTKITDLTADIARSAAELSLRFSLPMADAVIYATARKENCKVVTSDLHFKNLAGVIYL